MTKQLQVEYIDPEKRPSMADKLKENAMGTIVLEYEGRVQRVTSDAEQDVTNGLIKVVQGKQPKVYFVTGPWRTRPHRVGWRRVRRHRGGAEGR